MIKKGLSCYIKMNFCKKHIIGLKRYFSRKWCKMSRFCQDGAVCTFCKLDHVCHAFKAFYRVKYLRMTGNRWKYQYMLYTESSSYELANIKKIVYTNIIFNIINIELNISILMLSVNYWTHMYVYVCMYKLFKIYYDLYIYIDNVFKIILIC